MITFCPSFSQFSLSAACSLKFSPTPMHMFGFLQIFLQLLFRVCKLISVFQHLKAVQHVDFLPLFQSTEQVTPFCRSLHDMNPLECPTSSSSSSSSSSLSPSPVSALPPTPGPAAQRQLSHADKLRKVINELVETERTYVKVSVLFNAADGTLSHADCSAVWPLFVSFMANKCEWQRINLVCAFRTWAV